jgi:peptide/nickel transport system substrate-binding protein
MNKKTLFSLSIAVITLTSGFVSCKGKAKGGGTLVIREMGDADMLNPINTSSANARVITDLMFMAINGGESKGDYNLIPILTKELGKVSEVNEGEWKGGMKVDYEIREEAVWDNGTPITGHDYAFTIKTILNPKTNCEHLKSYYHWVADVVIDSMNPRKFTVYASKKYFKIEEFAGNYVIPAYNYDPNNIMKKFSVRDFNTDQKRQALKNNADILKFAEEFNSEKYQRDPKYITGFGPYKLESWTTGQEIVIVRKDNWWGDKFADLQQFWAFPKRIKFKVINDQNTAITALKDASIDAFEQIPAKDFQELEKNEDFKKKFNLEKKDYFGYSFLYMNLRNDKFRDLNVRKALAHAVNRDKINQTVYFGEFRKTESFVHPLQKTYNKDLVPYEFDLKKAAELLDQAGWKDSDGDGIRDKTISGKKIKLDIEFKYNAGNEQRKNVALIIQEDFKKIGINLNITAKEWTVFLQDLDKLQFEMTFAGFTTPARISDPKQTWHTTNSGPGGDNKSGWGNIESDKIIDDLGAELDYEKRKALYLKLQKIIHDDVPVVYLFAPINRMAISKKFEVETHFINPGFSINEFKAIQ